MPRANHPDAASVDTMPLAQLFELIESVGRHEIRNEQLIAALHTVSLFLIRRPEAHDLREHLLDIYGDALWDPSLNPTIMHQLCRDMTADPGARDLITQTEPEAHS